METSGWALAILTAAGRENRLYGFATFLTNPHFFFRHYNAVLVGY